MTTMSGEYYQKTDEILPLLLESEAYSDEFYIRDGKDPVAERQAIREWYESKGYRIPDELKKYFPDLADQVVNPDSPFAHNPEMRAELEEIAAEYFPDVDLNQVTWEQLNELAERLDEPKQSPNANVTNSEPEKAQSSAEKPIKSTSNTKPASTATSATNTKIEKLEAILDQHGAYSNEFYEAQGLDPIKQRQKVKDLYDSKGVELPEELKKYFPDKKPAPVETSSSPKPKPKKVNAPKPKQQTSPPGKAIPKASTGKNLPKKQLGNNGKLAIAAVIAGLVIGHVINDDDEEKQEDSKHGTTSRMTTSNYYDIQANSNDSQIASNISSYRYGRRVGGFM